MKQYEIRYVDNTHIYEWYCNDEKITDPHIIETALKNQNEEIQYWKHKVASALFILGRYVSSARLKDLIEEIEKDGYNLDKEIWGCEQ